MTPQPTKCCCCSSYTLGLFFILLVSLIWSAASVLVQFLYTNHSFDSPFLLTYVGVSLFTLLLPTKLAIEGCKSAFRYCCPSKQLRRRYRDGELEIITTSSDELGLYENIPSVHNHHGTEHEVVAPLTDDHNNTDSERYRDEPEDDDDEREEPSNPPHAADEEDSRRDQSSRDTEQPQQSAPPKEHVWTHRDHMIAALKIAPVWFIANWTYNASLAYTSITSSTVLASTGSVFTFLFALLCRDEQFTCLKLLGVLLGMTGSILTALHDAEQNNEDLSSGSTDDEVPARTTLPVLRFLWSHRSALVGPVRSGDAAAGWNQGRALVGDTLGLISAVGYGAYAVMVRVSCPRNESLMSMELLLGYIGLFNMIALSPVCFYELFVDGHAQSLTWVVFGFLVVKGLFDNVLSDYLWARAVVLTSATVATVGLGLTIPLAFASDVLMGNAGEDVLSWTSIAGAFSVLMGFVLVNVGYSGRDDKSEEVVEVQGTPENENVAGSDRHLHESTNSVDFNGTDDELQEQQQLPLTPVGSQLPPA